VRLLYLADIRFPLERANGIQTFETCRAAAPKMVEQGSGVVINVSSGGASRAHRGMVAYDASKGGVEAFTRAVAVDLAPYGVRCACIVPGHMEGGTPRKRAAIEGAREIGFAIVAMTLTLASVFAPLAFGWK